MHQLPSFAGDSFVASPNRYAHHQFERDVLQLLADRFRFKQLFDIHGLVLVQPGNEVSPGVVSIDPSDWQAEVSAHFFAKWGSSQCQNRLNILDAVLRSHGNRFLFSEADVQASFSNI